MTRGQIIRQTRMSKGLKLIDLAEKSGVQIATLSRIETDKMTGTWETHEAIAKALGTTMTQLYGGLSGGKASSPLPQVEAKSSEPSSDTFIHNDKASYEILTSQMFAKKMMTALLTLAPAGHTNKEENKAGTEKFAYVLEGNVELNVGGKIYPLQAGGSIYFDASSIHFFSNKGDKPAKIICVATPIAL